MKFTKKLFTFILVMFGLMVFPVIALADVGEIYLYTPVMDSMTYLECEYFEEGSSQSYRSEDGHFYVELFTFDATEYGMIGEGSLRELMELSTEGDMRKVKEIACGGVDSYPAQRIRFETGSNEDSGIVDVTAVWTEFKTYVFMVMVNADLWNGYAEGFDAGAAEELIDAWVSELEIRVAASDETLLRNGTSVTDRASGAVYKVLDAEDGTIEYTEPINKNARTYTVRNTVTLEGGNFRITSVAGKAFQGCKAVTSIKIGKYVKTIGTNAFYKCSKLKTVQIGKKVTSIGNRAFYKCTALTGITIPTEVKKIGKQAFYGCKKLKNITIRTSKLKSGTVGRQAFKGTYKNVKVKVPAKKYKSYRTLLVSRGISKKKNIVKG